MTRDDLLSIVDEGTVILDGEEFDEAVVGITTDGQLVYGYEELVAVVCEQGMPYEDAVDYVNYNTIRAVKYMGEKAPIVMISLVDHLQSE